MDVSWKRTWKQLVRQHFKNQFQIRRLHHELQRFRNKHNRIQQNIEKEAKGYEYKVQLINDLRKELDNFEERNKNKLSPVKRRKIQKLRELLPSDSLAERVKQMEILESKKPNIQSQSVGLKLPFKDRILSAQVKDQTAVTRRLAKIGADELALQRINHKTLVAMSDIRQLQFTIGYLKRAKCTKLKVNPYIDRTNWLEMTATPEVKDIRATIALDCSKKTKSKRKKLVTRRILDVRPPFILKNIPELMPGRYHYLKEALK